LAAAFSVTTSDSDAEESESLSDSLSLAAAFFSTGFAWVSSSSDEDAVSLLSEEDSAFLTSFLVSFLDSFFGGATGSASDSLSLEEESLLLLSGSTGFFSTKINYKRVKMREPFFAFLLARTSVSLTIAEILLLLFFLSEEDFFLTSNFAISITLMFDQNENFQIFFWSQGQNSLTENSDI
jgi:hypothetical protein